MTATEQTVAREWAKVLGAEAGPSDNFFERGGNSLLAGRVSVALGRVFPASIPFAAVLSHPVLRDLAAYVDQILGESGDEPRARPSRVSRELPLPMAAHQKARMLTELWARQHGEPGPGATVTIALRIDGDVPASRVESALDDLVAAHESLRVHLREQPDGPQVRVAASASAGLRVTPCPEVTPADRWARIEREFAVIGGRLDLTEPPLWRTHLLEFDADQRVLLLGIEHFVMDGESVDILIDDLCASLRGEPPVRKPGDLDYIDWVDWQQRQVTGVGRAPLAAYWRGVFAGTTAFPDLRLPRPAEPAAHGRAAVPVRLSRERTAAFLDSSGSGGGATFTRALAAVVMAWSRCQDQREVVVHTPTANRAYAEFERVIGWMAHSLPIRVVLDGGTGAGAVLDATRTAVRGALLHQELPLPEILDEIEPELRDKVIAARPRLFFDLEIVDDAAHDVPGATVRRLRVPPAEQGRAMVGVSFYGRLEDGRFSLEIVADPALVEPRFLDRLAAETEASITGLCAS